MGWFSELSKKQELIERNGSTYSVTNYKPLALVYATIDMLKKYDAVNVLSVPRSMSSRPPVSTTSRAPAPLWSRSLRPLTPRPST